jgi:hypothetical protein
MRLKCCGTQVLDCKGVYCSAQNAAVPSGIRDSESVGPGQTRIRPGISNCVSSILVFFCRIQPGLPSWYWTQIAVCTLHCESIIARGSCAARAALSRSSGGCTRRRCRTRCTGRSTGCGRRSGARAGWAAEAAAAAAGAGMNGTQERIILRDKN